MKYVIEKINARLRAENALNLSDSEIERCLRDCVMGHKLIPIAKGNKDKLKITKAGNHESMTNPQNKHS